MNSWGDAFLKQAASDFAAANVLLPYPDHCSQATMLLQMSWEKLARAALIHTGAWPSSRRDHAAAGTLISVLKRQGRADNERVWGKAFRDRLDALHIDLFALERLTPALAAEGENTEYPWLSSASSTASSIRWPAAHLTRRFGDPSSRPAIRLLHDFETILHNFSLWFA